MTMLARAAIGVLVLVLGVVARADAQDDISRLIGRPVASILFEVEGRPVATPALSALVALKAGDPFRLDVVREAETRLLVTGGYEDVQVAYSETPAGLVLVFKLAPRHPVASLEFRGDTGLSAADLRRLVEDRYGGLPAREPPASVARTLERMLHDEGFADARVEPEVVMTHNPDRATLVLTVSAGRRSVIVRTDVNGTSPWSDADVIKSTKTAAGQPFRRAEIETALAVVEDKLRQQGYYRAVAIIAAEPVASETGLVVTLQVDAGPKVRLTWEGIAGLPVVDMEDDLVPLSRQRSVDEDLLEDSDARVVSYLQSLGYRDATARHTRDEQGDELTITMHVNRGLKYVIDSVPVTGNTQIPFGEVKEIVGVEEGEPYNVAVVLSGISQLRTNYLRRGYYTVSISALDVEEVPGSRTATEARLRVPVEIVEGPLARIGTITLSGVRADLEPGLRRLMASTQGAPYTRELDAGDRERIETHYRDLGFESVVVNVRATPRTPDGSMLDLGVDVTEGPQIFVGDIAVTGTERVSEERVREEMVLKEGQPFGDAARRDSQRRLIQMGVFRQVLIEEQPRTSGETVAHVVVRVEELPPNAMYWGGGLEGGRQALTTSSGTTEDRIFFAPRGSFEYVRRNLWGKNRTIDVFSRIAPRPTTTTAKNFGFLEYRVSTTYREPHAFNSDTDLTLGVASEQVARTGFNYARRTAALQMLRQVRNGVVVTARYGLEHTRLFDVDPTFVADEQVQIALARLFPSGRLVPISSGIVWDRRDDFANPSRGTLASADVEVASRALGSQVGFAKVFLTASGYRAVSGSPRTVLAGRVELGLARGFSRVAVDENGNPLFDEGNQPVMVADLPVNQRFFAGGSTTVRGFQLDRLGRSDVLTRDGLSFGGNGLVVANGELRTTVGRLAGSDFGLALFTDIGNVFQKASDIDVTKLRMTLGFGLRYSSPLGAVRLDFGFKTDRQTFAGGRRERGWEYHLNIGEAF